MDAFSVLIRGPEKLENLRLGELDDYAVTVTQIELVNQIAPVPPNVGTWIRTERTQVLGGRLVRTVLVKRDLVQAGPASPSEIEADTRVGLTFVPEPGYAWRL